VCDRDKIFDVKTPEELSGKVEVKAETEEKDEGGKRLSSFHPWDHKYIQNCNHIL
jgi:hypothetical protein